MTIAMILGLAPIPAKTATGRQHTADGKPARPINNRGDRADAIEARWAAIRAICAHEPTTIAELRDATGIKDGTLADDLRKMFDKGLLRRRLHRAEALYWVAA